jgi:Uma2 family endonuclease
MSNVQTKLLSDTWVAVPWDEFLQFVEDPAHEKSKAYYHKGHARVEMQGTGSDHSNDHALIISAISLFGIIKGIPLNAKDNCSYRKSGVRECQPDVSYYVGDRAKLIPWGTMIVDLNKYAAPDLAIEIAVTSLLDDQGTKRSLYEEMGVAEYWVVDVQNMQILAYQMSDRGSNRIDQSNVLSGLAISTLEEALRHSRETDQSQVGAWLMEQFRA